MVPDDVVFLASPSTFDPSIVQMFIAFAAGARLVIVPDTMKMVPSKLCQILFDEEKVTILQVSTVLQVVYSHIHGPLTVSFKDGNCKI